MFPSRERPPPLSPILLAGILVRPLPPSLLQPILSVAFRAILRRHPDVFERLSCLAQPIFLIDPTDLPLVLELDANAQHPRLSVSCSGSGRAGATIRGPLLSLIELLEGRADGDALFFSRTLTIEGDTEAIVALRNALDDADLDLKHDLLQALGPLAPPVRHAIGLGERIYTRLNSDLELLRGALQHTQHKGPKV